MGREKDDNPAAGSASPPDPSGSEVTARASTEDEALDVFDDAARRRFGELISAAATKPPKRRRKKPPR